MARKRGVCHWCHRAWKRGHECARPHVIKGNLAVLSEPMEARTKVSGRFSDVQRDVIKAMQRGLILRASLFEHGHGDLRSPSGDFVRDVNTVTIRALYDSGVIRDHPHERRRYVLTDRGEALARQQAGAATRAPEMEV